MHQPNSTPSVAGRLALARVLTDASRSLQQLRVVRGASRRTQRRMAGNAAMMLAAAALLTAAPATASNSDFVVDRTMSGLVLVAASATIGCYGGASDELICVFGAANGDLVANRITNPLGLANVGSFAAPAFADLDGDGDPDALVGDGQGRVHFFANTGTAADPLFAAPVTSPFGLPQVDGRAKPAFADLDGDGDLDALIGSYNGGTTFFRNDGTATNPAFGVRLDNPFGLQGVGQFASPTLADLDQDGDLDAFIGNQAGATLFFQNTGSVTVPLFAAPVAVPILNVIGESSPLATDIDEDGDFDLVIGAVDGTFTVLLNQFSCPAMFAASSANPFGLPTAGDFADPVFVDIDGDGDPDAFIGTNGAPRLAFAENTGSAAAPAFAAPITNPFGLNVGTLFEVSPAFADIDGDGDFDAFFGEQYGNTLQFENVGRFNAPEFSQFPLSNPFPKAGDPFSKPTLGDLDGDGDLDVLVGGRYGDFFFSQNTGTVNAPAFEMPVTNPFGLSDTGDANNPTLVDLDEDGDLDLVTGESFGDLIVFTNTGSRTAPSFVGSTNPFGLTKANESSAPSFADIDGDGDVDALVGTFAGDIAFFENRARLAPNTPAPSATVTPPPTVVVVTVLPTETSTPTPSASPLPSATVTGSPATGTATATTSETPATATPTRTPGGPCVGDCNGNGEVAINELVFGVTIALGSGGLRDCPTLDADGDGNVEINELIQAVANALNRCP
jgi:hypothetical protein